jgi:acetoin utilization protein AcuB
MNVIDIMTPDPITAHPNDTLLAALRGMDRVHCHHLPVVSWDGHLVGILTEHDCRVALNSPLLPRDQALDRELASRVEVRAIMTTAPIIVEQDAPAEEAARLMLLHYISSLPVMRSETLVGIVTDSDILTAFMKLAKPPSPSPQDDAVVPHNGHPEAYSGPKRRVKQH